MILAVTAPHVPEHVIDVLLVRLHIAQRACSQIIAQPCPQDAKPAPAHPHVSTTPQHR